MSRFRKTHFHIKGFLPRVILKLSKATTRKYLVFSGYMAFSLSWSILQAFYSVSFKHSGDGENVSLERVRTRLPDTLKIKLLQASVFAFFFF